MNSLTPNQIRDMFLYVGQKVVENKPFLTKIDSAIGDGTLWHWHVGWIYKSRGEL